MLKTLLEIYLLRRAKQRLLSRYTPYICLALRSDWFEGTSEQLVAEIQEGIDFRYVLDNWLVYKGIDTKYVEQIRLAWVDKMIYDRRKNVIRNPFASKG